MCSSAAEKRDYVAFAVGRQYFLSPKIFETRGYADSKKCGGPTHWLSDAQILASVRSLHAEYRQPYGSPRITEKLKSRGIPVSWDRVKHLMKANGIGPRHKRRYKTPINSKHAMRIAPVFCVTGSSTAGQSSALRSSQTISEAASAAFAVKR